MFLLFLIYRVILLALNSFPFNSDEAVVGLMAKHILDGNRPLFFYGQSYMGSLDAFIVAGFFKIFGETVGLIRIVQSILFFITVVTIYYFVIIAFRDHLIAFLSAIFLIFAPVNLILYSSVSLGGYGEAMLIGSLVFLLTAFFIQHLDGKKNINLQNYLQLTFIGFLSGIGLWTNPLCLTFCAPAILAIIFALLKFRIRVQKIVLCLLVLLLFFLAGSFFWWYSLLATQNSSFLSELIGSAVSVEQGNFFHRTWQHLISFLLFAPTVIFGFRPPWDVKLVAPILMLPVILFWLIAILDTIKNFDKTHRIKKIFLLMLIGIGVFNFLGFVFTSFGVDPSGRYFLPFYMPLAILSGRIVKKYPYKIAISIFFVATIFYNLYGTISLAKNNPHLTTQFYQPAQVDQSALPQLIVFLQENNEFYGYSNYWVSYPLAFLSNEKIIAIPALPYHLDLSYTNRDNRIEIYNQRVNQSPSKFYITTNNKMLDEFLIDRFRLNNIQYHYQEIGDFHVYYHLTRQISPLQLGLYKNDNFK